MIDPHRKHWNEQQQKLQALLKHPTDHPAAVALFLSQHAALHARAVGGDDGGWSFEEALWDGLSEAAARRIPAGSEHSIAWIVWHLARIEDMTMNVLVAGAEQIFTPEWQARIGAGMIDTGNAASSAAVAALSAAVDLPALRAYRTEVGRATRALVRRIQPAQLRQKVDPARIERLRASGSVVPEAGAVLDYWGGRTIAGLLLMPPTRHNFLHLNEAERIKKANR